MSTSLAGLTTNYFPSAQNGFTTALASTIASGAATVPLNSVAGYTNGQIAVFIVDPSDANKKQTFTGVIDTAGIQVTSVIWTAGTSQTHAGGAVVVDYASATHISMITKGLLAAGLTQAGGMGAIAPTSVVATGNITAANFIQTGGASANGWTVGVPAPNTVTALGNRNYSMVFNGTDQTGVLSPGMRLRSTRTVAAPTQSTSLNGTTQFYSKTSPAGMTFTDDFVVSAWVKLSSYNGVSNIVASRYNGTSGWDFGINASGQLFLEGVNANAANTSYVESYQSIPLNKWVHVAAQLDMSTFTTTTITSYIMIDGVDVPAFVSRTGTNPVALIQAGNLEIGSRNGGTLPFTGKIAQVAIYSAKVTQAILLASMHQTLAGTETSLISAYSFNNTINDLNANANNLTANGSAVATNADSPFGGQADGTISSTLDYGVITATTFSTNTTLTVLVPEGNTMPTSGGVSAVSYSTQKTPYQFPGINNPFSEVLLLSGFSSATIAGIDISGATTGSITIPTGKTIRVTAYGQVLKSGSAGDALTLNLYEDSVVKQNWSFNMPGSNYTIHANLVTPTFKPAAGSHTYKLNLSATGAGTMQFTGSITLPAFLRIEIIDL